MSRSLVFAGQPMIDQGQRPDENQVSSTSSSCSSVNLASPANFFAFAVASSSVRPTTQFLPSLRCMFWMSENTIGRQSAMRCLRPALGLRG